MTQTTIYIKYSFKPDKKLKDIFNKKQIAQMIGEEMMANGCVAKTEILRSPASADLTITVFAWPFKKDIQLP